MKNKSESLSTTVKELESELETRTKDVNVAEASNITLRKQIEEFLFENDRLSETNQVLNNQLLSSSTRLQQLESELQMKRNEANAAEANAATLRKEKQVLKIQLQSSSTSLRHREYELETKIKSVAAAEAKNFDLRRQEDLRLEHDRLLEKNQNLKNQLQSSSTRFEKVALRNEDQILKNQLQSSSTRLRQNQQKPILML